MLWSNSNNDDITIPDMFEVKGQQDSVINGMNKLYLIKMSMLGLGT